MFSTLWGSEHIHDLHTCMLVGKHVLHMYLPTGCHYLQIGEVIIVLVFGTMYLVGSSTLKSNGWLPSLLNTIRCFTLPYLLLESLSSSLIIMVTLQVFFQFSFLKIGDSPNYKVQAPASSRSNTNNSLIWVELEIRLIIGFYVHLFLKLYLFSLEIQAVHWSKTHHWALDKLTVHDYVQNSR